MAKHSDTLVVNNPATGVKVGAVQRSSVDEVDRALVRAKEAQREWASSPRHVRYEILTAYAKAVERQVDELALLLAMESGKPLAQTIVEVAASARLTRRYAERMLSAEEKALFLDSQAGLESDVLFTRHEPLGVVAAIVPFNFPVELGAHKIIPAIATGNAVVVKPPELDPLTLTRQVEMLLAAGLPEGVVQVLNGEAEVGQAMVRSPLVSAVTFTGSTSTGMQVALAGAQTMKKVMLELGGNDSLLVLPDADLEAVVAEAMAGRSLANGQVCVANKRIIAHKDVTEDLIEALSSRFRQLEIGDQLDATTDIGPLISRAAVSKVKDQIRATVDAGASITTGRRHLDESFVAPTVLRDVTAEMDIARDMEIFGPVLPVIAVASTEEAICVANSSRFGLSGAVFSRDLTTALDVARRLETGQVVINGSGLHRADVAPFGGVKDSGNSREGVTTGMDEFVQSKAIVLRGHRQAGP